MNFFYLIVFLFSCAMRTQAEDSKNKTVEQRTWPCSEPLNEEIKKFALQKVSIQNDFFVLTSSGGFIGTGVGQWVLNYEEGILYFWREGKSPKKNSPEELKLKHDQLKSLLEKSQKWDQLKDIASEGADTFSFQYIHWSSTKKIEKCLTMIHPDGVEKEKAKPYHELIARFQAFTKK